MELPCGLLKDSVFPLQGAWVWSLVGELRSHMLHSTAKTTKKKKKVSSWNSTTNNPIKKWAEDLNRHFSKEYIWCSTPVWKVVHQHELSGNCKSKPQYYFTSIRMTIVKKTRNNRWRGCEEKGTLIHCWRDCKLVQSLWKKVCKFFKKFRTTHTHTQWNTTQP